MFIGMFFYKDSFICENFSSNFNSFGIDINLFGIGIGWNFQSHPHPFRSSFQSNQVSKKRKFFKVPLDTFFQAFTTSNKNNENRQAKTFQIESFAYPLKSAALTFQLVILSKEIFLRGSSVFYGSCKLFFLVSSLYLWVNFLCPLYERHCAGNFSLNVSLSSLTLMCPDIYVRVSTTFI